MCLRSSAARLCDSCLASVAQGTPDDMHGRNFGCSAAWELTTVDHPTYLAMESDATVSPWIAVEGFRVESVAYDWLHNVYLGTARDLIGSALRVLVKDGAYNHVQSENMDIILAHVHGEMREVCNAHGFLQ